jgi:hypothetical protein
MRGLVEMFQKGKSHKEISNGDKKGCPSYRTRVTNEQEQQRAQDGKEYRPTEYRIAKLVINYIFHYSLFLSATEQQVKSKK